MDPETGSARYMISGGIAGGAMSVEQVLAEFVAYVFSGILTIVIYHLIESAILLLVPATWIVGAIRILQAIRIIVAVYALISFIYSACSLIELFIYTGDVYYLQELLIQIAALSMILALNITLLKGLHQKIEWLKNEIVVLKLTVLYGMGRINQAKATMGFFKDYGLSNDALRIIGRNFTPEIIAQIENTYVKSLVFYTGNDTDSF